MRKLLLIAAVIIVSLTAVFVAVHAATYTGTMTFTCSEVFDLTPNSVTFTRDNTGQGGELYNIHIVDGAGNLLGDVTGSLPVGFVTLFGSFTYFMPPEANPITLTWTSLAGNGLPAEIITIQQGNCPDLPIPAGSCLPLTANAVVGDVPLGAQTYYAPGQVASGVVLNPGTYWILGQDESHQFYKILLACEYLWIPVDTAQPSFEPPWQGQPLPTDNVE